MTSICNKVINGRKIVLGISGGIAAYKSADLARKLIKNGADLEVVMTAGAQEFLGPLTMQAITGKPVHVEIWNSVKGDAMEHISLARWAELILIAPATANVIARLAAGMSDDLLTTLCLATESKIAVAPAMNRLMFSNAATQDNLATLRQRGILCWGPDEGEQACGEIGPGRMMEPQAIVDLVQATLNPNRGTLLKGIRVAITAGPTREPIDPVRFVTNHSSGKMGYAIATAAVNQGADVTVITGPTKLPTPENARVVSVTSASDMMSAALKVAPNTDIFVGCAAVGDFSISEQFRQKLKLTSDTVCLTFKKNPDIIATVASLPAGQRPAFVVGFAAETENVESNAKNKLAKKNLNAICANDVSFPGQGFGGDNNAIKLYWLSGNNSYAVIDIPLADKLAVAQQLWYHVFKLYKESITQSTGTPLIE